MVLESKAKKSFRRFGSRWRLDRWRRWRRRAGSSSLSTERSRLLSSRESTSPKVRPQTPNFGLRSYFVIKRDKLVECKNLSRCLSSHSTLESFFSERTRLKIIGSHRRRQEEAQAQKRNQLMSNERYNLSIQAVYLKLCSFPVTFPCGTTLFW